MNYVSLCKRLAVCTALGIALSLPVGAVWNTMQPQLAYAEEYSSLRGNIIENAYLLVGTPFKMGGSFPSEGFDGSGYVQYVFGWFCVRVKVTGTDRKCHNGTQHNSKRALE